MNPYVVLRRRTACAQIFHSGARREPLNITAENGVLEVVIPKQPQVQPRRIAIDA